VLIESWFVTALFSAFFLASADTLTKKYMSDYSGEELSLVRFGFTGLILAPFCFLNPLPAVPQEFWMWVGLCMPLEWLALLLYMLAIRDSPLYLTLPYLALTPVFSVLTGWVVLGETVSAQGLVGILLVVTGTVLLNIRHVGDRESLTRRADGSRSAWKLFWWAIAHDRGSRYMLGAAFIYSVTSVMSKQAMGFVTPISFGPFYAVCIGVFVLLISGIRKPSSLRVFTRRPALHLFTNGLIAAMVVTHFIALANVEVAYMITVKRTSLLFGLFYGWMFFGEHHLGQHLVAGSLILGGVACILL
jgi:drug/metabolite transporter (DMT)-like permease